MKPGERIEYTMEKSRVDKEEKELSKFQNKGWKIWRKPNSWRNEKPESEM